jgi:hypothetical protein
MLKEKAILALQDKIAEEYQSDMAAIKRVLRLMRKKGIRPDGVKPRKEKTQESELISMSVQAVNGGGIEHRINAAIQKMTGHFTLVQLMELLEQDNPDLETNRNTVSGVLFRNKDKTVRVVEAGRGRKAAIYEKI